MQDNLEDYLDRLRTTWPWMEIENTRLNPDGLVNDGVAVSTAAPSRVSLFAQAIAREWAPLGVKTGEKDWFAAY